MRLTACTFTANAWSSSRSQTSTLWNAAQLSTRSAELRRTRGPLRVSSATSSSGGRRENLRAAREHGLEVGGELAPSAGDEDTFRLTAPRRTARSAA